MMTHHASFWFLANLFGIILLEFAFPMSIVLPLTQIFGIFFLLSALVIALWSKDVFLRHETSYNPKDQALHLITDGIYSFSRNPIYIALIMAFVGISLILSLNYVFFGSLSLFFILSKLIIPREEKELYETFGNEYLNYKSVTPRWF